MTPQDRATLLSFPEEDLAVATPQELEMVVRATELHLQLLTPLDYAVTVSGAKRFKHVELLNQWLMAQLNGNLFFDGPGPDPVQLTVDMFVSEAVEPIIHGWTSQDSAYDDVENVDAIPHLKECADGFAYDEDGFLILVHPVRGDRPIYNFAISMPPRHGKSYLVSEHLPAWFLSNYPQYSVLLASYNESFAGDWGGLVRNHIVDHPEFGISITGGRNASKGSWMLEGQRGYMRCAGVGGTLTGRGGQLIVVDDPIKNHEEALSATTRESHGNWWASTLYTRREPWEDGTPGRVILMSTRWHEDDLHGRLVPEPPVIGNIWCQMNLMAIFEPNDEEPSDPLGRIEGSALCPARVPKRELNEIRKANALWFEAMYQGHPSLEEGNIIKRPFRYYTAETEEDETIYALQKENGEVQMILASQCYRFATLDLAASDKKTADWTVMCVWDVSPTTPRHLILVGVERLRITTENHEEHIISWYKKWGVRVLHIENKTYGTNLIGGLKKARGIVVAPLDGDQNPLVRIMPLQQEIRNEHVWFPKDAEWLKGFEAELTKFPNGRWDDQVDTAAYGVQVFLTLPAYLHKPKDPETPMEIAIAHRKELARKNRPGRRARLPGIGRW